MGLNGEDNFDMGVGIHHLNRQESNLSREADYNKGLHTPITYGETKLFSVNSEHILGTKDCSSKRIAKYSNQLISKYRYG